MNDWVRSKTFTQVPHRNCEPLEGRMEACAPALRFMPKIKRKPSVRGCKQNSVARDAHELICKLLSPLKVIRKQIEVMRRLSSDMLHNLERNRKIEGFVGKRKFLSRPREQYSLSFLAPMFFSGPWVDPITIPAELTKIENICAVPTADVQNLAISTNLELFEDRDEPLSCPCHIRLPLDRFELIEVSGGFKVQLIRAELRQFTPYRMTSTVFARMNRQTRRNSSPQKNQRTSMTSK